MSDTTYAATRPLLLGLDDAWTALGIGRSTGYRLMESGELRSVHIGSRRFIPAAALDEFVASLAA